MLAPDEGNGYLWRLVSFARFEERDGGLYLELEVIGLSKDLPGSLRFLLRPVKRNAGYSARTTLRCGRHRNPLPELQR
jgi:hypothetical protein